MKISLPPIDPGTIRRRAMGVGPKRATAFSEGGTPAWTHLETAALAAVGGYNSVLESRGLDDLVPRLDAVAPDLQGYAYDGAAMGLVALDCFTPGGSRYADYLAGPGEKHIYMAHIGAGEALARLRRKPEPFIAQLPDRVLCWLVMDGYGFHEGFFRTKRFVERQVVPTHLSDYGRRVFDQGLGRSVWFTAGAQVERIAATIGQFPPARQVDLWLGVGVACTYVGGVDRAAIERLRELAGPHAGRLSVGAAFVAKGRLRAGNPVAHTDLACDVLCAGASSDDAALIVEAAFDHLPVDGPHPAYELLQQRISTSFLEPTGTPS